MVFCNDFHRLNKPIINYFSITKYNVYFELAWLNYFSTLDLTTGVHYIKIRKDYKKRITFSTALESMNLSAYFFIKEWPTYILRIDDERSYRVT